jgi:ribonuclease III
MDSSSKFKANPYNLNNKLITSTDVINIMKKLNIDDFTINDIKLYQTAFVHNSYCRLRDYEEYKYPGDNYLSLQEKSYEAIEFLGDAILGSSVTSYIFDRFYKIHNQNEGFLTKLKIRLVCGENLSKLADSLNLNQYLIISKHIEDNCDGRNNKNILEDSLEALIGAIYLDHDYETANQFIIQVIQNHVDFTDILLTDTNYKDQISRYFQQIDKNNFRPLYKHRKEDNKYYCELYFKDKLIMKGEGLSKKKSEQDVSKKALIHFNVIT